MQSARRVHARSALVLLALALALATATGACGGSKLEPKPDAGTPDLAPPSAPQVELFSPSPLDTPDVQLTVLDCSDRAALLVNEGARPSPEAAGWQACSTAPGALAGRLSAGGGLHLLRVWAKDAAGNVSDAFASVDVVRGSMFAVGQDHTCALVAGRVSCWGSNAAGELGLGSSDESAASPRALSVLGDRVDAIASASHARHTCALKGGGVWCWGADELGQLGVPQAPQTCAIELPCSRVPVQVVDAAGQPLQGAVELAVGQYFSCARMSDATVRCWGGNGVGQLGNGEGGGNNDFVPTAAPVPQLSGVRALTAGVQTVCAQGETLQCWGFDGQDGLGTGFWRLLSVLGGPTCAHGATCRKTPLTPEVLAAAEAPDALGLGYAQACALTKGAVRCWGANFLGQLGIGDDVNSAALVEPLLLGEKADLLGIGAHHGCARVTDGRLLCWGLNDAGQLGSLTSDRCGSERQYDCSRVPLAVLDLAHVRALTVGRYHACAVAEGQVVCWGSNQYGQLGVATSETCRIEADRPLPCSHKPLPIAALRAP